MVMTGAKDDNDISGANGGNGVEASREEAANYEEEASDGGNNIGEGYVFIYICTFVLSYLCTMLLV